MSHARQARRIARTYADVLGARAGIEAVIDYHKESKGAQCGDLSMFNEMDRINGHTEGWTATEHVRKMNIEYSRFWQWIKDHSNSLPIVST